MLRKEGNNLIFIEKLSVMIEPKKEDNSFTLWTGMLEGNHSIKKGDVIEKESEKDKFEIMRFVSRKAGSLGAKDNLLTELDLLKFGQFLFCGRCVSKACLFFREFRTDKETVENTPLRRSDMSIESVYPNSRTPAECYVSCVGDGLPIPLEIVQSLVC